MSIWVTDTPYLADPTGQRPSTEAFNKAIQYQNEIDAAGKAPPAVLVPEGNYLITDEIRNVQCLIGVDPINTVLNVPETFKKDGVVLIPKAGDWCTIKNLQIQCVDTSSYSTATGISTKYGAVHYGLFENLRIRRLTRGMEIIGDSWGNTFRDIQLWGCGGLYDNEWAFECTANDCLWDRLHILGSSPPYARQGWGGYSAAAGNCFTQLHVEGVYHEHVRTDNAS
jgi:hypothetical protein